MSEKAAKIDFAMGGQAILEGVMMRSPHGYSVSVRTPKGGIEHRESAYRSWTEKSFFKLPLIRGVVHLAESMVLGLRVLDFSNRVFLEEDLEAKDGFWQGILSLVTTVFGLGLGIVILKVLPLWIAGALSKVWPFLTEHYWAFNLVDGISKMVLFLGYLGLLSFLPDVRRVFEYHGAEHKTIWAYEKGLPLTVENAKAQTRFHPRCGTSFIFLVIVVSVIVYTVIPEMHGFAAQLGARLIVIPLIAGLSYELLKWSAKHQDWTLVNLITWPGLMLQRITTREPDDSQLEIALHALNASLAYEKNLVP